MSEIVLGLIVLAILGGHFWYVQEKNKETKKLINALVSKNPEQMRDLEMVDKVQIKPAKPIEEFEPDLSPLAGLSQDDFDEHIKETLHG